MQTGKILDPEQREKYDFTRTILTVLLRTVTGNEHYYTHYYVDQRGEWVEISYDNECSLRKIPVTGNSLLQITKDVLKTF